jgi:hypothetical protein
MAVSIVQIPLEVGKPKFRLFALGENDGYPTIDFLEELKISNADSHDRLIAELSHVSENGPITNDKRKCRLLCQNPKIYEFKTKDLSRIAWFYDRGQMILCTHGFKKPKERELQQQIAVAKVWHTRYCSARDGKTLQIE